MVIDRKINLNYGFTPQQLGAEDGAMSQTLSQPRAKEVRALFENAGVIVTASNVGDMQKTLQEILLSVKEKKLDIAQFEIVNALAALAASVDGPEQKAALNILALATKTIENTVKNMTMTSEEREKLIRRKSQAKTDEEKAALDKEIEGKDVELKRLQGELDEAKASVSRAIRALGGSAAIVLRGAMRVLAVSAFVRAAQDRLLERKDIESEIEVSRKILEVFVGIEREQGLDLGLGKVIPEVESVYRELDTRLLERDLQA